MYRNNGSVLVLGMLVTSILILFGGLFLSLTVDNYKYLYTDSEMVKAHWIARAGLNQMIHDVRDHYFSYYQFLDTQKKYAEGVKFGDGTYKGGIGIVTGPGIREVLLISEGIMNGNNKDAIVVKLRITTPADFLKFTDGHFSFYQELGIYKIFWGGPIHANGSIRFSLNGKYLHIRKDDKLKGPVISCNGIVFHDGQYNNSPPMIVGEGDVSGMFDENTDINKYTSETMNNDFTIPAFYIKQYGWYNGLLNAPVLTSFSNGNSPDSITFEVRKPDNVLQPLIMDGFHGGYNIAIPKTDKILSTFEPYIDPNWKISYNNLCSGRTVEFYNDDLQKKQRLTGSGYVYSFQSAGIKELGDIKTNNGMRYCTLDNTSQTYFNVANNIRSLDFYPDYRYVKLYNDNGAINNNSYVIKYELGRLPHAATTSAKIIFNNTYSGSTKIHSTKIQNVYLTNDTEKYTARGIDVNPLGIRVCPANLDINDQSGIITFKTFINEPPSISDVTGTIYKTANLMDQNSVVVSSVNKYDYSGKSYADVNNPPSPDIDTINPTVKWLDDSLGRKVGTSSQPDDCEMDMSGNIIDGSGGDVVFMPRKYLPSRGTVKVKVDEVEYNCWRDEITWNNTLNMDFPIIAKKTGTNEPDVHIYYLNVSTDSTIPTNTSDSRLHEINQNGSTDIDPVGTYPWTYNSRTAGYTGSVNLDLTQFYDFKFTNKLPTNENPNYLILMSYKYKYRPITNVFANLLSPNNVSYTATDSSFSFTGFKAVVMDQYIKAVEIDLSNINPANYPKYGVIFSEVPLIVKGIPSKPITIVCLDDVYCGPINSSYYRDDGQLVSSSLTDDDTKAQPVGIISAGAVWNYFHLNNRTPIPLEDPTYPYISPHDKYDTSFHVKLNKVAIYSQSNEIFNYDGLTFSNCGELIGSFISATSQMGPDVVNAKYLKYNYAGASNSYKQGLYGEWGDNPQKYASSFRRSLSPHFPTDVKIKNWQPFTSADTEKFIKELSQYLNDTSYSGDPEKLEEVYKDLTIKYFSGI